MSEDTPINMDSPNKLEIPDQKDGFHGHFRNNSFQDQK